MSWKDIGLVTLTPDGEEDDSFGSGYLFSSFVTYGLTFVIMSFLIFGLAGIGFDKIVLFVCSVVPFEFFTQGTNILMAVPFLVTVLILLFVFYLFFNVTGPWFFAHFLGLQSYFMRKNAVKYANTYRDLIKNEDIVAVFWESAAYKGRSWLFSGFLMCIILFTGMFIIFNGVSLPFYEPVAGYVYRWFALLSFCGLFIATLVLLQVESYARFMSFLFFIIGLVVLVRAEPYPFIDHSPVILSVAVVLGLFVIRDFVKFGKYRYLFLTKSMLHCVEGHSFPVSVFCKPKIASSIEPIKIVCSPGCFGEQWQVTDRQGQTLRTYPFFTSGQRFCEVASKNSKMIQYIRSSQGVSSYGGKKGLIVSALWVVWLFLLSFPSLHFLAMVSGGMFEHLSKPGLATKEYVERFQDSARIHPFKILPRILFARLALYERDMDAAKQQFQEIDTILKLLPEEASKKYAKIETVELYELLRDEVLPVLEKVESGETSGWEPSGKGKSSFLLAIEKMLLLEQVEDKGPTTSAPELLNEVMKVEPSAMAAPFWLCYELVSDAIRQVKSPGGPDAYILDNFISAFAKSKLKVTSTLGFIKEDSQWFRPARSLITAPLVLSERDLFRCALMAFIKDRNFPDRHKFIEQTNDTCCNFDSDIWLPFLSEPPSTGEAFMTVIHDAKKNYKSAYSLDWKAIEKLSDKELEGWFKEARRKDGRLVSGKYYTAVREDERFDWLFKR